MAEALTIKPPPCAKLGVVHCGMIGEGAVGCSGDMVVLEAVADHLHTRTAIQVKWNGSDHALENISS